MSQMMAEGAVNNLRVEIEDFETERDELRGKSAKLEYDLKVASEERNAAEAKLVELNGLITTYEQDVSRFTIPQMPPDDSGLEKFFSRS